MRVLVITNMYPRDENPSYGIFVAEQLRSLRGAGVEADLYFIEGYRKRAAYLKAIPELRRRRGAYDVFHAHHAFSALAASLAGARPLVTTIHEGAVTAHATYRCFARWVAGRADRCVAVSPALARALAPTRCDVIPIGVDLSIFRPRDRFAARHELGLRADRKYVLFPADPARPEKRFDLASRAVARARAEEPALELLALPPSPRAAVAAYFGAADVALVTSDFESGPLTVKEAVASGRPVVSRRVGDVDFLEKCGACVVAGDGEAEIAAAIIRALGVQPGDGEEVRAYALDAVARRLAALYEEVAAAKAEESGRGR